MSAAEQQVSIWMQPENVERSGPGRRPGYSRAQIVEVAVRIADAEGIDAATMRRIAQEMGTGAMSLYRYVPKRDDLIDLMLDAVLGEIDLPERASGDWRADLSLVAHRTRGVGLSHPWQVALARRPTLGPNSLRVYDFMLGALDGFGLHIDEMTSLSGMVSDYVASAVRDEIGWLDHARHTGMDRRQWMAEYVGPYVRRVVESGKYPMFNRTIREGRLSHMSPDARFRYGLDHVLNGIAAALPASPGGPDTDLL
ncbi:TetR/AcrR family transcriptional regulator C-terminal domain-containing protein [Dactylosporangium fulvum]|uniref:TetR/AcrR family transcriptional regulator n=1 Tax=Dactylosporangium fulvum TaxID=53359 RepID=A0ABY5VT90_9ACTN|nr:TetR/AcrR family transcriptional regulator [Dactylosporangium fulvum]UWP79031.1 TetR/AcrR family transcriptional regulator [Dactylosporangium fulvum]